jgi:hypothetical protein
LIGRLLEFTVTTFGLIGIAALIFGAFAGKYFGVKRRPSRTGGRQESAAPLPLLTQAHV